MKLLGKKKKVSESFEIDGTKVELCKPSHGERIEVFEKSKAAGEIVSESGEEKPKDAKAMLRFGARVVALCLYDPETGKPHFPEGDEYLDKMTKEPWFEEVLPKCMGLFHAEGVQGK